MTALRVILDRVYAEVHPGAAFLKARRVGSDVYTALWYRGGHIGLYMPNQSGTAEKPSSLATGMKVFILS
jgi:hypothetical protein